MNIKKTQDTDLINKITQLSHITNNENSSIKDIKNAVSEMRAIVNHTGLIFQTVQDIFNRTVNNLSVKIDHFNNEDDEYSLKWVKFMHKTYELKSIDNDISIIDNNVNLIPLTEKISIPQTSWLKFEAPDVLILHIGNSTIRTTISELKQLTFDYSSNICKTSHKKLRHIGPLNSLELDIKRLRNHPELFKIEQNKIKSHIIYNLLLYLALNQN